MTHGTTRWSCCYLKFSFNVWAPTDEVTTAIPEIRSMAAARPEFFIFFLSCRCGLYEARSKSAWMANHQVALFWFAQMHWVSIWTNFPKGEDSYWAHCLMLANFSSSMRIIQRCATTACTIDVKHSGVCGLSYTRPNKLFTKSLFARPLCFDPAFQGLIWRGHIGQLTFGWVSFCRPSKSCPTWDRSWLVVVRRWTGAIGALSWHCQSAWTRCTDTSLVL